MELAFVLAFVLLGAGAIVYAGMRKPARKPDASGDGTPVVVDSSDTRADGDAGSGGDGGGGD